MPFQRASLPLDLLQPYMAFTWRAKRELELWSPGALDPSGVSRDGGCPEISPDVGEMRWDEIFLGK